MPENFEQKEEICIITGLSGAGKSTALHVFEDLNYFVVDGLPASLAPEVAAMLKREPMKKFRGMAIGMDMRQDNFLQEFDKIYQELAEENRSIKLIFLKADNATLMRRYAATRRPHPLEKQGLGLEMAISRERELLQPLMDRADAVIDTANFSIHDLRRDILRRFAPSSPDSHTMRINLMSFGFKYGLPNDADFVFDLRFLDNPYFVENLKLLSGKDKAVADYIFKNPASSEFMRRLLDLLNYILPMMEKEGRYRVTIAFGCTGGRHRSVALAEEVGQALLNEHYPVSITHRHLHEDVKNR